MQYFLKFSRGVFLKKKKLAGILVDILGIERKSVYRRLRQEVPFSFSEISKICSELSISLDNLIGMGYDSRKVRPVRFIIQNYLRPTKTDYDLLNSYVEALKQLKENDKSEICVVGNTLPQFLCVRYEYLYRFYLLKWSIQHSGAISKFHYKDIIVTDKLARINREYLETYSSARKTHVALDRHILKHIKDDIEYFSFFNILEKEEIEKIKEELLILINDLNTLCMNGCYPNGNEINIYISHVHLEAAMETIDISDDMKISLCAWLSNMDSASVDHITFQTVRKWIEAVTRTSTLISQSADVERIKFFNEQIKIVNNL